MLLASFDIDGKYTQSFILSDIFDVYQRLHSRGEGSGEFVGDTFFYPPSLPACTISNFGTKRDRELFTASYPEIMTAPSWHLTISIKQEDLNRGTSKIVVVFKTRKKGLEEMLVPGAKSIKEGATKAGNAIVDTFVEGAKRIVSKKRTKTDRDTVSQDLSSRARADKDLLSLNTESNAEKTTGGDESEASEYVQEPPTASASGSQSLVVGVK
jgi:hypothetical protein